MPFMPKSFIAGSVILCNFMPNGRSLWGSSVIPCIPPLKLLCRLKISPLHMSQSHMSCFRIETYLHSRYMKTQHIKFEILSERLSVFKCNLIQLNLVQTILVIGQIFYANFHPFGDVRDDVTKSLDVCHR